MLDLVRDIWRRSLIKLAPIWAGGLLVILIAAPSASAQAALDQYVPSAKPAAKSEGTAATTGGQVDTLGPGGTGSPAVAVDSDSGSDRGGTLPLADYPGTPFVWIIIAILLAAALVRVAAPVIERRGIRGSG
jgi:hypothetical protein